MPGASRNIGHGARSCRTWLRVLGFGLALGCVPIAQAHADAHDPLAELGDYERDAVHFGLRYLGLEIAAEAEGKLIGSIWVLNLETFDAKSGALRVLNYLHRTTRPDVIEREVLLRPGEPMDWERVHETERNLNNPLLSMLVIIVPVRGDRSDTVDLLVVTRDSWSLRTDSSFEVQAGVLSHLFMEPSDFNFLGLRKQVGMLFDMDLGKYIVGPIYLDRNLLGTRVKTSYFAGLVFNRQTSRVEGSASDIDVEYPLWSLDSAWGARVHGSHRVFVSRLFQDFGVFTYDAPETPEDDAVPWEFDMRELNLDVEFVRAFGGVYKNRVTLAQELRVQRPDVREGFAAGEVVRQAFVRDVLPRSELTSAVALRYHLFRAEFARYRNVNTYDVSEDRQLGLDATLETALGAGFLGSETDFVRLGGTLSFSGDLLGAGFFRLALAASTRLEEARAYDSEVDFEARLVSPSVARAGRLVARVRVAHRFRDRQNIVYPIGGETGLRGYVIGAFVGRAMAVANLEARSSPVSLGFTKLGAVAFWDVGHAAEQVGDLRPVHDFGVGLRFMVPQFARELFRVDWAFATSGPTAGFPGRLSIGYDQAF
jgi:hypothetical protein